jgi:hypothetical protein
MKTSNTLFLRDAQAVAVRVGGSVMCLESGYSFSKDTLLQPGGTLLEVLVGCVAADLATQLTIWLGFFAIPAAARSSRQMAGPRP